MSKLRNYPFLDSVCTAGGNTYGSDSPLGDGLLTTSLLPRLVSSLVICLFSFLLFPKGILSLYFLENELFQ